MRQSRWAWWAMLLLVLAAFPACRSSLSTQASGAGGPQDATALKCLYLHDQKYAVDQDLVSAQDWKAQLCAGLGDSKPAEPHYDLFSHQGGGPLGAEWNSDGDLCILIQLPISLTKNAHAHLSVNGKPWREIAFDTNPEGACRVLDLPFAEWNRMLRPIRKADYTLLYDGAAIENFKGQAGSPLGVGKMLDFTLRFRFEGKRFEVRKAFHIDWGE